MAIAFYVASAQQPSAAAFYKGWQTRIAQAISTGRTTEAADLLNNLANSTTVHPELREAARRWVQANG